MTWIYTRARGSIVESSCPRARITAPHYTCQGRRSLCNARPFPRGVYRCNIATLVNHCPRLCRCKRKTRTYAIKVLRPTVLPLVLISRGGRPGDLSPPPWRPELHSNTAFRCVKNVTDVVCSTRKASDSFREFRVH